MKLQTRLTLTLAAGIVLVITGFQAVQSSRLQGHFEKVGQANARILKDNLSGNAEDVQRAVEFGIATAMANGDMDVFDKVTSLQKDLHGLQEFSLYNEKGRITYSSDHSRLKSEMDPGLKQQLYNNPGRLVSESAGLIDIYQPRVVTKSCLECHTDWKAGIVAGVTLFRYSKQSLADAQNQSSLVTHQAQRSSFQMSFVTIGGSLLAIIILVALIIRPVIKRLGQMAESLNRGSQQVNDSADQVSAASQSLAEGASEQAASLEETSSSLEEMASMTKRNAENAQKANDLAKQARSAADKGVGDMQQMNQAMQAIKTSSNDIAKIIKTIDEIAFQTNILALNAAVEAARAGEAGMGFAVVADEVRNLAQRSAQAAKETAGKIEGAIGNTAQGVDISSKVALTLNEIATKARQVDELVAEVAGASREQTQGITQINTAVSQMDKVTQSNAASAEESAAAAEELNAQAISMKESVAELLQLVGGNGQGAATRTTTAHAQTKSVHVAAPTAKRPAPVRDNGHAHTEPAMSGKTNGHSEIPLEGDFKDF